MSISEWEDALMMKLIDHANALAQELAPLSPERRFEIVKHVIDDNEIVLGLWPDEGLDEGFGRLIVKGEMLLRSILASGEGAKAKISSIPCLSLDQAIAAREVLGDEAILGSKSH